MAIAATNWSCTGPFLGSNIARAPRPPPLRPPSPPTEAETSAGGDDSFGDPFVDPLSSDAAEGGEASFMLHVTRWSEAQRSERHTSPLTVTRVKSSPTTRSDRQCSASARADVSVTAVPRNLKVHIHFCNLVHLVR